MKKNGMYTVSLLRAQNTFTFGLSRTCYRETRGFSLSQTSVVVIDLTTNMKLALITENYGVQKSLVVFYLMKDLHPEFFTNHLICIRKMLNDGQFVRL
jgi:hypothetical protein